MKLRSCIVVAAIIVGVAACSSDDSGSGPDDTPTAETVRGTDPPPTDPESTTPDTAPDSAPATEPTSTEPAPTLPDGELDEACLQGDWVLPADRTTALMAQLLPGFPVTVDGTMALSFDDGQAEQYVNVVATFTLPEGTVSVPLDQRFAGPYSATDNSVLIDSTVVEGGWGPATANLGGVSVEVPVPVGDVPGITGGPARCSDTTLSLLYTSGLADSVAEFDRV
jgi:hypothetical protein